MKRNWFYFPIAGVFALALLVWTARQAMRPTNQPDGVPPIAPPANNAPVANAPAAPTPRIEMHVFPGVQGPTNLSVLAPTTPADWRCYAAGGTNRLAILLTEPDDSWLGLAHGLRSLGVPFLFTTNTAQALAHRVVLVYPRLNGAVLGAADLRALAAHPRTHGTLIACGDIAGGLEEIFGFARAEESSRHYEIGFPGGQPLTAQFTHPRERVIRVADPQRPEAVAGKYHFTQPTNAPLAVYEDGSAPSSRAHGKLDSRAHSVSTPATCCYSDTTSARKASRAYVNEFEPTLDVLLRLLRELYVTAAPAPVTLGTVPFGKLAPVLLTHDVDFNRSLTNALAYAEFEAAEGIRATYFTQVKYLRDFNDVAFFNDTAPPILQRLRALGHELASHSVSHSKDFARFPPGTGAERYPDYQPFVRTPILTLNGSVLGELRVSKFLLEHFGSEEVASFRPGHLRNPFMLPQMLAATGYRQSSSATANNALTHLPFQLNYDRARTAEVPVFEFPVTIEDELPPLLGQRVTAALDLVRQLGRYGGLVNVLIHPDITGHKLQFERHFVAALKPHAWFGTLNEFATWWAARDAVSVDVELSSNFAAVTLRAPQSLTGLPLQVPAAWRLQQVAPADLSVTPVGHALVLGPLPSQARLIFRR